MPNQAEEGRHVERRRGLARKLLLCACSALLAVGVCEITFRLMGLAPAVHRIRPRDKKSAFRCSNNLILGYVFKENHREGDDVYTNSHGQRDIERSYAKPPGRKRILVLGDSVVAGTGIRDLNDTISRQLEKLYVNENVEVLNFGVDGYCTRAEVELLKVRGLKYQPDLVILVFTINDYFNINMDMQRIRHDRPGFVEWLFIRSHLFRFMCLKMNWFGFFHQQAFENVPVDLIQPNNVMRATIEKLDRESRSPTIKKYLDAMGDNNVEDGLRLLRELSGEHGFGVLMAIWPHFHGQDILDGESRGAYDYGHDISAVDEDTPLTIEGIAGQNGIRAFRLSGYFRSHLKTHPSAAEDAEKYYTNDDGMHPSPGGARVAAEALKAILDSNPEYLERRKPDGPVRQTTAARLRPCEIPSTPAGRD